MNTESQLYDTEARLALNQEQLERLQGVCAQLILANHALEDRAVLLLGGLIEITKIKGSPPIQVARTIASRVINTCKEQQKNNECPIPEAKDPNPDQVLCGASPDQGPAQHEAGDISGRAN